MLPIRIALMLPATVLAPATVIVLRMSEAAAAETVATHAVKAAATETASVRVAVPAPAAISPSTTATTAAKSASIPSRGGQRLRRHRERETNCHQSRGFADIISRFHRGVSFMKSIFTAFFGSCGLKRLAGNDSGNFQSESTAMYSGEPGRVL